MTPVIVFLQCSPHQVDSKVSSECDRPNSHWPSLSFPLFLLPFLRSEQLLSFHWHDVPNQYISLHFTSFPFARAFFTCVQLSCAMLSEFTSVHFKEERERKNKQSRHLARKHMAVEPPRVRETTGLCANCPSSFFFLSPLPHYACPFSSFSR